MTQLMFEGREYQHIRLSDNPRTGRTEEDNVLWKYTNMGYSVYKTGKGSNYLVVNESNPCQKYLIEVRNQRIIEHTQRRVIR